MSDTNKERDALRVCIAALECAESEMRDWHSEHPARVQISNAIDDAQSALSTPHPETPAPLRGEAKVRDVGFIYENGNHTPTVLVEFNVADFDARDRFVAALKEVAAPMPQSAGVTEAERADLLTAQFCIASVGDASATIAPEVAERVISLLERLALAPGLSGWQEKDAIVSAALVWYESSHKAEPEHELAMAILRYKNAGIAPHQPQPDMGNPITAQPQPEGVTRSQIIEECCALIKSADDAAADNEYMLDSNDCISVLRGTWQAPLANDFPKQPQPEPTSKGIGDE